MVEAMLVALGLLLCLAGGVFVLQRQLLLPAPKPGAIVSSPHHRIHSLCVAVNGKMLQARLAVPHEAIGEQLGVLYFNGRRENPTTIFRALPELPHHQVLCFFYDGLGWCWRKPGEEELVADAVAVLDWWAQQGTVPVDRISVVGRSLGSTFAVHVAAARPVRQLVLISPADQLLTVLRRHVPWLPRAWLRDRYDNRGPVKQVRCPCLLVVAADDATIPPSASRALLSTWRGNLTEWIVQRCGHRGILRRPDVHRVLADFLRSPRHLSRPAAWPSNQAGSG